MNIIPLILLFCIAFALQYLLTFLQMRSLMSSYRKLRKWRSEKPGAPSAPGLLPCLP